jgi:low temperature requirement protein LtrA
MGVSRSEKTMQQHPLEHRAWNLRFGFRQSLVRPKASERSDRVTYIELFFDLIFVFALTQLSRFLYANQSWVGALESIILVLALWWLWVYTTWVTNWLDPARLPVRSVVIGLALIGLVISTSIYDSFNDQGLVFAIAYVALQLGRTIFMVLALARHEPALHATFLRILLWLSVAGVFWVVGALLPLSMRLPAWLIALAIEYGSASLGFRIPGLKAPGVDDWDVSGPHIAERSALFVIIAIGESFLVTGFAFVDQEASGVGVAGVFLAFVNGVAMWWLYFDHGEQAGSKAISASSEPGRIARLAYTYVHVIIIAGIVVTSVADKNVLEHPEDSMTLPVAVTIVGGPLFYIVGLLLFRWIVTRTVLVSHVVGLGLLALAGAAAAVMTPLGLGAATSVSLVTVAAWETVARARTGTTDDDAG